MRSAELRGGDFDERGVHGGRRGDGVAGFAETLEVEGNCFADELLDLDAGVGDHAESGGVGQ
jgi:hypothetical protein